jgi:hypothetical protein
MYEQEDDSYEAPYSHEDPENDDEEARDKKERTPPDEDHAAGKNTGTGHEFPDEKYWKRENIQLGEAILNEWRENNSVWRKPNGGFGAKNRRGKLKYFKDRSSARSFASTGSTAGSIKDVVVEQPTPVPPQDDSNNLSAGEMLSRTREHVKNMLAQAGTTPAEVLNKMTYRKASVPMKELDKGTYDGYLDYQLSDPGSESSQIENDPNYANSRVSNHIKHAFRRSAIKSGQPPRYSKSGRPMNPNPEFPMDPDEMEYLRQNPIPKEDESISTQLETYLPADLLERNYAKEYANYQGRPDQKKKRAMRNKVRREALRAGTAKKGDGKDIHHKDHNPHNSDASNLAKIDKGHNRSMNGHHPGEKMKVNELDKDTYRNAANKRWDKGSAKTRKPAGEQWYSELNTPEHLKPVYRSKSLDKYDRAEELRAKKVGASRDPFKKEVDERKEVYGSRDQKDMNSEWAAQRAQALRDMGGKPHTDSSRDSEKAKQAAFARQQTNDAVDIPSGNWSTSTHSDSMSNMSNGSKKDLLMKAYLLDALKKMKAVQDLGEGTSVVKEMDASTYFRAFSKRGKEMNQATNPADIKRLSDKAVRLYQAGANKTITGFSGRDADSDDADLGESNGTC